MRRTLSKWFVFIGANDVIRRYEHCFTINVRYYYLYTYIPFSPFPQRHFSAVKCSHHELPNLFTPYLPSHKPLNLAQPAAPAFCCFVALWLTSPAPKSLSKYLPSSATFPLTSLLLPIPFPKSAPSPA